MTHYIANWSQKCTCMTNRFTLSIVYIVFVKIDCDYDPSDAELIANDYAIMERSARDD